MLFMILYTSMRSALSRLYSSDGRFNFFDLSWYDRCLMFDTNFVALLRTFSIDIMSFFVQRCAHGHGIFNMGTNTFFC